MWWAQQICLLLFKDTLLRLLAYDYSTLISSPEFYPGYINILNTQR